MQKTQSPAQILKQFFGYDKFRGQQEEIIDHVINGNNAFVLMPTGSGKSMCYQVPALCLEGITVVISPLIALMQDQVQALKQAGVRAEAINSGIAQADVWEIKQMINDGNLDLLYVAPERLVMPDFLDLLTNAKIALFAIDEAHCVSQWGHDFRPVYTELSILAEKFPKVPRIALTATADGATRKDILQKLCLENGKIFTAGFDRPNINYSISTNQNSKKQLLNFIKTKHSGDSGIVYCLSRKKTEEISAWLKDEGFNSFPYHAGMSASKRQTNLKKFLLEDAVIMVATIAFGMGIDKPDVRFVAHLNIPKTIEAYYQETGRAGRDGLPANTWMSYGLSDVAMQINFIEEGNAPENQKRIERQKLNSLLGLCEATNCRRQVLLEYFGDKCEPCGNCDNCLNPPETFDGTTAALKALSCVYRTEQRFGVAYLIDVLSGTEDARIKNFHHNKLSVFGIGTEFSKKEWQSIFRQLVAMNLIKVDISGHGGIHITNQGFSFLKQKNPIKLRKLTAQIKTKTEKKKKVIHNLEGERENELFAKLKAKRLELAKSNNLPPYIIFHDKSLIEMVKTNPQSLEDMSGISGVGEAKIKSYGQIFLDIITEDKLAQG